MTTTRNIAAGVAFASISAGPIFFAIMAAGAWMANSHRPTSFDPGLLFGVVAFLPVVAAIGLLLSIVPNLVGTLLMAGLGKVAPLSRSRAVWAMAGALSGFGLASFFGTGGFGSEDWQAVLPLILVSAACASISRHFVRWADDAE